LNWTVTDTNLDTCIFEWNGANTTLTCNDNTTSFNITDGTVKNLTFYVNDTFGNSNSQTVTWNYRLFLNSETFDEEAFEGLTTTFSANFLTNGSSITRANLSYNSTENLGTISDHGSNNFTVSETITVPVIDNDVNVSFYWNITQGAFFYALDEQNQTILNVNIDDCSTNSVVLYNFTMKDEEQQTIISGTGKNTSAQLNMQLYGFGSTTLIEEFNKSYENTNPFAICLNQTITGTQMFSHDLQVQYGADGYSTELYHIQNDTINSTNLYQNITLLDLNLTDAQVFKIIFKDSAFIPVEDALIKVYRKYIAENEFKITEIPKTDEKGETVAHLVIDKVIYNIVVVKFGETLASFNNVIAVCQTPLVQECQIDLNAFSESIDLPDFEDAEDFSFTLGYDNDTRVVSSVFSIPSGTVSLVDLNVTQEDALGTSVCADSLTSSSGTLTCIVPASFGNSTISAKIYKSGSLQAQGNIKLDQNPSDIYGVSLVVLAMFIMITLIGAGVSDNPVYSVIFLMVGVIFLFVLNLVANNGFIGATATILWLIIAIILVIIKGARRN
jgi:hypothetical protein